MPRLDRIGHAEDDVVIGGRAVEADIAGERNDAVLRTFHRRQLVDRRLQRASGTDRQHLRLRQLQPALDFGSTRLGNADGRRGRPRIARHDLHMLQPVSVAQARRRLQTCGDRMVEPNLDQPLGHGERNEPLRRLARNPHDGRDLVLGAAGDIV
ncbi:hypothetical protein D9M70_561250 [compost metagenome]